jgi:hypothetical protein
MKKKKQQKLDCYTYSALWSAKDNLFIACVAEFPLLAAHGKLKTKHLKKLRLQ